MALTGQKTGSKVSSDLERELARNIVDIGVLFFGYNVATDWNYVEVSRTVQLSNPLRVKYIAETNSVFDSWVTVYTKPREIVLQSVAVGYAGLHKVATPALGDVRNIVERLGLETIPVLFLNNNATLAVPVIPVDLPSALNLVASRGAILEVAKAVGVDEEIVELVKLTVERVLSTSIGRLPEIENKSKPYSLNMLVVPASSSLPRLEYYRYYYQEDCRGDPEDFVEFVAPYGDEKIFFHYRLSALGGRDYGRSLYKILKLLNAPLDLLVEELSVARSYFMKAAMLIRAFENLAFQLS